MAETTWLANPFHHPLFWVVIQQIAILLSVGFVVVVLLNINNLQNTFHSAIWNHFLSWQLLIVPFLIVPFCGALIILATTVLLLFYSLKQYNSYLHLPYIYHQILGFNALLSLLTVLFCAHNAHVLPFTYLLTGAAAILWSRQTENVLPNMSLILFGSIWIIFALVHFPLISTMTNGWEKLIILGVAVATADFCAFAFAQLYQRTYKGPQQVLYLDKRRMGVLLAGHLAGAWIGINFLQFIEPDFTIPEGILLSLLVGVSTFFGQSLLDLIKHYVETKDHTYFSSLPLGILDRIGVFLIPVVVSYHFLAK